MQNAFTLVLSFVLVSLIAGCGNEPAEMHAPAAQSGHPSGVIDVKAVGLTFETPDSIQSGWTTFRFENTADVEHFAVVQTLPEGIGLEEHQAQVAPVFQAGFDLLRAGKPDSAFAAFGALPEWYGNVVFLGGPGLTSPGRTSQTTMYLEPGKYLFECYLKTDGTFHAYNVNPGKHGMVRELVVTTERSSAPAPEADLQVSISSERGIEADTVAGPGEYTVAVHFADQMQHENFVGHDVHLARMTEDSDVEQLEAWMDWSQASGLQAPGPAEFIGGVEEMPAGGTQYFTVTIEPGTYAWVSEVPNSIDKGMLRTFTVAAAEGTGS